MSASIRQDYTFQQNKSTPQPDQNINKSLPPIQQEPPIKIDMNHILKNFQSDHTPGIDGIDLFIEDLEFEQDSIINPSRLSPNKQIEVSRLDLPTPKLIQDGIEYQMREQRKQGLDNKIDIKRTVSDMPKNQQFILSGNQLQSKTQKLQSENELLRNQLKERTIELNTLRETFNKIQSSIARIYSTPKLLQNEFDDKELVKIFSQGFLAQAKLHLAFLFSSPLTTKYKNQDTNDVQVKTIQAIDHGQELQGVLEGLKETNNQIRYRKIPATLDNLRIILTENPVAFHFSGHGIENNQDNFGKDIALLKDAGNMLIFEDSEGQAQFLSEKMLHSLLESSGTKLEFVFVASCYSQFAGEIFHNAGAKHVICIRRGEKILDEASIIFSRAFYHKLFSQTVTVCEAFNFAKTTLQCNKNRQIANEAFKFVILKDNDEEGCFQGGGVELNAFSNNNNMPVAYKPPKKHKCTIFGPFVKGNIENIGTEPLFRLEVSKVEDFLGRRLEMQEVIQNIATNRLVTIKGIPGIGKTTLAKTVAYFLDERQAFKDGIIMISLRGLHQANMFLDRLFVTINKIVKMKEEKQQELNLEEKIIDNLKDKEILLVVDNAEDSLKEDGFGLKEIWQNILTRCPKVKLLITSRMNVGNLQDITEKILHLKELLPFFSIKLLFRKARREITDEEINELLLSEPAKVLHSNPLRASKNTKKIEEHHMVDLLAGHPHAISLTAPLLQGKTLIELYKMLNSQDIMGWLRDEGVDAPLASLKVSLDASISFMQQKEPKAIQQFCLIGLLPGGCTEDDLISLWGQDWMNYADKLERASLLLKRNQLSGEVRYSLLPFMNNYACELMEPEERKQLHQKCCKYLAQKCKDIFKINSKQPSAAPAPTSTDIMNRLVLHETNIWACIYRMIDKKNECIYEASLSHSQTRGKSPAHSIQRSQYIDVNGKSCDESSQQNNNSSDEEDKDYDKILNHRQKQGRRSHSERFQKAERGFNQQDVDSQGYQNMQEEEKEQSNISSENFDQKRDSRINNLFEEEEKMPFSTVKAYKQPQTLTQSEDVFMNNHTLFGEREHGNSCMTIERTYFDELDKVLPTQNIANLLSDDQTSLISPRNCNRKAKKSSSNLDNATDQMKSAFKKDDQYQSDSEVQKNISQIDFENFLEITQTSSYEIQSFSTNQLINNNNNSSNASKTKIKTNFLDVTTSTIQHVDQPEESVSYEGLENMNYFQLQQIVFQETPGGNQAPQQARDRRKSIKSNVNHVQLDNIDEIPEEHSFEYKEDEEIKENNNDEVHQELKIQQRLSMKKYQEDEGVLDNEIQSQINNDMEQSLQTDSKIDIKKKKNVKFQENQQIPEKQSECKQSDLKRQVQTNSVANIKRIQKSQPIQATAEGQLLIYYISNLALLCKYQEAQKAVEQFGQKLEDTLCKANMKKLLGYILYNQGTDYKQAFKSFEEAYKLFRDIDSIHGMAICNFACGFIYFSKVAQFQEKPLDENKIFKRAKNKLQEALECYTKISHYAGAAQCHRILGLLVNKMAKQVNTREVEEHNQQQRHLSKKDLDLQKENKSTFIWRTQLDENSFFIEIIDQVIDDKIKGGIKTSELKQPTKIKNDVKLRKDSHLKPPEDKKTLARQTVSQKKENPSTFKTMVVKRDQAQQQIIAPNQNQLSTDDKKLSTMQKLKKFQQSKQYSENNQTNSQIIPAKNQLKKPQTQLQPTNKESCNENKDILDKLQFQAIKKQYNESMVSSDNESQVQQVVQSLSNFKQQELQRPSKSRNDKVAKANTQQFNSSLKTSSMLNSQRTSNIRSKDQENLKQKAEIIFDKASDSSSQSNRSFDKQSDSQFSQQDPDNSFLQKTRSKLRLPSFTKTVGSFEKSKQIMNQKQTKHQKIESISSINDQPIQSKRPTQLEDSGQLKYSSSFGGNNMIKISRTAATSPRPQSPGIMMRKNQAQRETLISHSHKKVAINITQNGITTQITLDNEVNINLDLDGGNGQQ